jgi:hypothetical protein
MGPDRGGNEQRPDPFREEQPEGYHYSRRDRLSMATAPRSREKGGGIFRRNRTLLIILLDLVVILILGVFLVRFLYARVNRADLEGYSVVLRGVRSEEVVLASLTITNKAAVSVGQQSVFLSLSLDRHAGEEELIYVSELAPPDRGGERILRATVPISDSRPSPDVLYAEVRIGDSRKRLSAGLEP